MEQKNHQKYGQLIQPAIYPNNTKGQGFPLPQLPGPSSSINHNVPENNGNNPDASISSQSRQTIQLSAFRSINRGPVPTPVAPVPKTVEDYVAMRQDQLSSEIQSNGGPSDLRAELMMFQMKQQQEELRDNVLESYRMRNATIMEQSHRALDMNLLDRGFYRRVDTPNAFRNKQEARMIDKYEQQMRNGQELKKKNKHRQGIAEILSFHRDFFEFHKKKYASLRKLTTASRNKFDLKDKHEQHQRDRDEQARLKALREMNLEEYINLVKSSKNERIYEIFRKTDQYLQELGAKVRIQKGEAEASDDEIVESQGYDDVLNRITKSTNVYYKITHTIEEQATQQPSILEGGILKSYQMNGLNWLLSLFNNHLHGILADEMGLGKTIQTIALFSYIIEYKKEYGPFLVVVPLSTVSNWESELTKWAPSISKVCYKGPPAIRKQIAQSLSSRDYNVVLTTYEYIMKDKNVLNKFHWVYIVVDEGHRMKNSKSKFAQTLGQNFSSQHRLLLTGTPLQNNLAELWSLLNFLVPKIFSSVDDFDKWFNQPLKSKQLDDQTDLNEEETLVVVNMMHQVLRPFLLRREKKEVESELPEKREHVLKVELSHWQKLLYRQINDKGSFGIEASNSRVRQLANSVMQLRKVCNHPYLFYPEYEDFVITNEIWRSSGKFDLIDRIIPKLLVFKHRILIFSQMTQLLDILQRYLEYRQYRYLRLDGSTKAEIRDEHTKLFNAPESPYDIFLLSTRAGGLGLNLQSADTVIIFDSDWNPQMDKQAQDRAHRIGQTREVRVYRLVTNTALEEAILSRADEKKILDEQVIQAGIFNTKFNEHDHQQKLKQLFQNNDVEEEKEVYDDEQINSLIARSEEELLEFEKMDEERYKHEKFGDTRIYTESDYIPLWIQNDELKYEEERPRRKRALVMKDLPSDSEEFYEYDDSENEESTKK